MRHVEEHTLEEEHERHPLVIRVVSLLFGLLTLSVVLGTETRMGHLLAHSFALVLRQRERGRDPAECIDHVSLRRGLANTVNGVSCKRIIENY